MPASLVGGLTRWVKGKVRRARALFLDPAQFNTLKGAFDATRLELAASEQRFAALTARIDSLAGAIGELRRETVCDRDEAVCEVVRAATAAATAAAADRLIHECHSVRDDLAHRVHAARDVVLERVGAVEERVTAAALSRAATQAVVRAIRTAGRGALFECVFNGVRVMLPRETLETMTHCVTAGPDRPLEVWLESLHFDWLRSKLAAGDVFLDVGAATGAMAVPYAVERPGLTVVAFEPSRTARKLLVDTVAANGVGGSVEVVPAAVSDAAGELEFAEMGYDATGARPFQPEKSSLAATNLEWQHVVDRYAVPVVTLDGFFAARGDAARVTAVKIDVEGFETHVLRGATEFLAGVKPHLSIDIHPDPFAAGSTEGPVRALLAPLGYTFEKPNHVLLCTPPGA